MKTILFTHTDLDGVSCAIVAKLFYPNVKVLYCNYHEVNDIMREELAKYHHTVRVIISDIAYSQDCTDITIDLLSKHEVFIADHHMSSVWMNNVFFSWKGHHCNCVADGDKCGAVLLYEMLLKTNLHEDYSRHIISRRVRKYLDLVNQWDLWTWTEQENYNKENLYQNKPLLLSNAHGMMSTARFESNIMSYLTGEEDNLFSKRDIRNVRRYNDKQMKIINDIVAGRKIGWVDTEDYGRLKFFYCVDGNYYQSLIAQVLRSYATDEDFILVAEPDGGSLRSIKTDIDLSKIAKQFGCGGHKAAAKADIATYGSAFHVEGVEVKPTQDNHE